MSESYHYPNTILNANNAARSMSFYVYEQRGLVMSVNEALTEAKDRLMELSERDIAVATTLEDTMNNLRANESQTNATMLCVITLPIPNNFSDSQSHGWDSQQSLMGEVGSHIVNKNIADTALTEIGAIASSINFNDSGKEIGIGALKGLILGKAARSTNISADSILANRANETGQRKPIIDPSYFQNYKGSTTRTFVAKYDLVPHSAAEAYQIMMIISKFKQFSSPSQVTGTPMLSSPYSFKVTNNNSFMDLLTSVDMMVLTNISVDYGADGNMEVFSDGMPKYISLTMNFAESRLRTAEDYMTTPKTVQSLYN